MKFKDLEAYQAVMTTGSTLAAANLLGISQSAVSRRISQLETDLGLPLFFRENGRLTPSRTNELLESHIADIIERVHILNTSVTNIRSGHHSSALLRIAVPPSLCRKIMPEIISDFLVKYPDTRFEVSHGTYDIIHRMLDEKQAEIGFLRLPLTTSDLTHSEVIEARSVCVMARDHPLAHLESIHPGDLRDQSLVLLGSRRAPRHDLDLVFSAHGIRPKIRLEAHSVSSACGFAEQGIGISIVNSLLVQDCLDLDIIVRPFIPYVPHHFAFVHADQPGLPEIAIEFIAFVNSRLQALVQKANEALS